MKILFDHQIFSSQKVGGISRYHVELIKHLSAEWEIPLFFSNNLYIRELMSVPSFFPEFQFRGKNRLLERINRIKTVSALKKGEFDIFHPTFYESFALEYLKDKPLVLTLHDMTHDRCPELPAAKWEKREKYAMACAADAVIVPSQFTADELMACYHICANKIHVVHHGAPEWHFKERTVVENRFLFVGGRTFYKNFPMVLKALKMVPESTLTVVGPPFNDEEKKIIQSLEVEKQITQIRASDEELTELYASSSALIFSSKMEGFGLPVLEAFAAGCPVICSDIPVFREVGGDTALYFDPDSPASLAEVMRQNMKARCTENLAAQLAKFSWKKCADETYQVYESILKK